ncbi:MAG: phage holin family protein [Tannerellaceae bacterium]|nr:phage holin family protein [Tannerellaceae bacterium]MCD8263989.1 phage holin family protein [Tannerellaceae bacterium]
MEKETGQVFRELKEDLSSFVELKLELLKLNTYERVSKVLAILSYGVVVLFVVFLAILFLFLALGFYLGDVFNSNALGFGAVALIYILVVVIVILSKDKVSALIRNIMIASMMGDDEENNATDYKEDEFTGETDR